MYTDDELIKKKDIFHPIEDDDNIDWKYNPFDVDSTDGTEETPDQLMSQITFEGSPQLQAKLKALVREYIDVHGHTRLSSLSMDGLNGTESPWDSKARALSFNVL